MFTANNVEIAYLSESGPVAAHKITDLSRRQGAFRIGPGGHLLLEIARCGRTMPAGGQTLMHGNIVTVIETIADDTAEAVAAREGKNHSSAMKLFGQRQ